MSKNTGHEVQGIVQPAAYFVCCSACGEGVACPSTGSVLLTSESIAKLGRSVECMCGASVRLPRNVLRLGFPGRIK